MRRSDRDFFELSAAGRADEGPDKQRSLIVDNVPVELDNQLTSGKPILRLKHRLRARQENRWPLEDVPWNVCFAPIVSQRMRDVLEEHAPTQVQFLPVELKKLRQRAPLTYWLLNVLRVVDCHHRALSKWTISSVGGPTRWSFSDFVLDSARVPKRTVIFMPTRFPTLLLVRRCLREAIEVAGITGAQFYDVNQA